MEWNLRINIALPESIARAISESRNCSANLMGHPLNFIGFFFFLRLFLCQEFLKLLINRYRCSTVMDSWKLLSIRWLKLHLHFCHSYHGDLYAQKRKQQKGKCVKHPTNFSTTLVSFVGLMIFQYNTKKSWVQSLQLLTSAVSFEYSSSWCNWSELHRKSTTILCFCSKGKCLSTSKAIRTLHQLNFVL